MFFFQNGCDISTGLFVNKSHALGIKVVSQIICASINGGEGIGQSFDSADFDNCHKFECLKVDRFSCSNFSTCKPDNSLTFAGISSEVTNASPTRIASTLAFANRSTSFAVKIPLSATTAISGGIIGRSFSVVSRV